MALVLAWGTEKHNIHSLELPLIKHVEGPDTIRYDKFDWITTTSPEAAAVFLQGWKAAGSPKVRVALVGAVTARVFDEVSQSDDQSLEVAFSPSKAMGKVLASELPRSNENRCKVLYPASAKAGHEIQDGLSERGFDVMRLNTYTTVPVEDVEPLTLNLAISAPVVAVASPSALRAWLNLVSKVDSWNNSVACIGETTASVAKKLGLKSIYYPRTPGLEGWVESILEALRVYIYRQSKMRRTLANLPVLTRGQPPSPSAIALARPTHTPPHRILPPAATLRNPLDPSTGSQRRVAAAGKRATGAAATVWAGAVAALEGLSRIRGCCAPLRPRSRAGPRSALGPSPSVLPVRRRPALWSATQAPPSMLIGVGLKYALKPGGLVQLLVVLRMTVGWISTYMFWVANKDMTYAQQLREKSWRACEAELQALLEQVEQKKQITLLSATPCSSTCV
ncbi:hypothetical protein U9M48_007855 [Paspalum notatum var. saurae]|uniref:Uroporphyrinogen-III synthase n=1 Tax=Paspalum notatum var. saurae TaxID=547442 RepID=A0AAQ3SNU7_PASNO